MGAHKRRAYTHTGQMFGGKTAEEFHRANAFPIDAKCAGCRTRRVGHVARVFMPLDEAIKRDGNLLLMIAAGEHSVLSRITEFKDGSKVKKFIRVSMTYSCDHCRVEFEKECAKAQSWCIVEIDHGPGPDKIQVAVT